MTTTANLKDVAKIAGVSVSTVSRALNGKSCVNEETKTGSWMLWSRQIIDPISYQKV